MFNMRITYTSLMHSTVNNVSVEESSNPALCSDGWIYHHTLDYSRSYQEEIRHNSQMLDI